MNERARYSAAHDFAEERGDKSGMRAARKGLALVERPPEEWELKRAPRTSPARKLANFRAGMEEQINAALAANRSPAGRLGVVQALLEAGLIEAHQARALLDGPEFA